MAKGKFVSPHSQCRIVIGSSRRFSCVFFFLSLAFSLFIGCLCHTTSPNILSVCPHAPGSLFASTHGYFVMPQWLHRDIFSQCISPSIESSPASFNFMKMVVRSRSLVGNFPSSCIAICMSTSLSFLLVCIRHVVLLLCISWNSLNVNFMLVSLPSLLSGLSDPCHLLCLCACHFNRKCICVSRWNDVAWWHFNLHCLVFYGTLQLVIFLSTTIIRSCVYSMLLSHSRACLTVSEYKSVLKHIPIIFSTYFILVVRVQKFGK